MWRILLVITGVIMSFQLIGGDTTNPSAIVNQVNQNIAQLKVQDVTNIFKDDTGTRRVLLGKGKNDFYGMKVSQVGTDVYDGADEDMVFNSDNNLFKIVTTGTYTLTGTYDGAVEHYNVFTIPHGLAFTPVVIAFYDGTRPLPFFEVGAGLSVEIQAMWEISVDETNIYILHTIPTGTSGDYFNTIKYYLLQETAN